MKKIILFIITLCTVVLLSSIKINAIDTAQEVGETISLASGSKSCILIEETTGTILYEKDPHKRLSPASMTKIMTLLLIFEAMENNQFNKETILTADEYSCSMGGSQVYLKVGEEITVDEALKCVCIASANDCAVLFATQIAGTEAAFVNKMNEKVTELGLKNTKFSDCTGLSSKEHYSSAYDMAMISKELITKYPQVLEYTSLQEDYIRKDTESPFWLVNTNKLVGRVAGISGLKTGYTSFSGYCITLHMKQNNMGLISVVFGYDKPTTRNAESLELLRYGYSNYKLECVLEENTVLESINHILYKNKIDIVVKENIYHLSKKTEANNYKHNYTYNLNTLDGKIEIYNNGNKLGEYEIDFSEKPKKKNVFEVMCSIFNKIFI